MWSSIADGLRIYRYSAKNNYKTLVIENSTTHRNIHWHPQLDWKKEW